MSCIRCKLSNNFVLGKNKNSTRYFMTTLLKSTCQNAMDYEAYKALVHDLVQHKETTGADTSEEKVALTKLNASRLRRLDKTISIPEVAVEHFRNITTPQTWILIVESWCADAVQTIPVIHKIAEISSKVNFKMVLRDENDALMNHFLTNGARAIPKLLIMDEACKVYDTWGPRSKNATQLVMDYKKEHGRIDDEFKKNLQLWYLKDGGAAIIEDLVNKTMATTSEEGIISAI